MIRGLFDRMYRFRECVILFVIIYLQTILGAKTFGPYRSVIHNITYCDGMPNDTIPVTVKYTKTRKGQSDEVTVDAVFPKPLGPIAGSVSVKKWFDGMYTDMFQYDASKICDVASTNLASEYWPRIDKKCNLMKGPQKIKITDTDKVCHIFSGNYLAYGVYKTTILIKYGRRYLGCREIVSEMKPI